MGQHKFNETAKLAKEGLLPQKEQKLTKSEIQQIVQNRMMEILQNDQKLAPLLAVNRMLKSKGC